MECNWPHLRCGSSNLGGIDGWDPHVGIMRMVYSRVQHVWTCLDMSMYVLDILDIRFYFIAHGCHSNGGEYTLDAINSLPNRLEIFQQKGLAL